MSTDLPRNLYFGAEDWLIAKPEIAEKDIAVIRNQRHNLVGHVTHKAEKLIAAVRSIRDFDTTGNAGAALDHVEAIRDDLAKVTANLITDVEDAEARYDQHSTPETPAAAVEPTPQAPAAAGTKPGPTPADVAAIVNSALDAVEHNRRVGAR